VFPSLHFCSEMQLIEPTLSAMDVAAHCTHVMLTALLRSQFETERDIATQVSSLRHFFCQECAVAVHEAE
jgi:hypothetical protein